MKLLYTVSLALACLLGSSPSKAQTTPVPAPSVIATKVGVIDANVVIAETGEGKKEGADLQAQFKPRQVELEELSKQIKDLQSQLKDDKLSGEQKSTLTSKSEALQKTYQRKGQEAQDDFNKAQSEAVNKIARNLGVVVQQYATTNGYALILDRSSQSSPVIFAADSSDLSQIIIKLYDQLYPQK